MHLNYQVHDLIHHLCLIDRVGPAAILTLLKSFNILDDQSQIILGKTDTASFEMLYQFSVSDLISRTHCSRAFAERVVIGLQERKKFEQEKRECDEHGVRIITIASKDYPNSLRNIHLPPVLLYVQGQALVNDHRSLAIVGSRLAGNYAQKIVDYLVPDLVSAGWTIVSGGARGVDTFAHQSALDHKGKTVVVLGSGLSCLYPKENNRLFEKIRSEGGSLVSAFPLHATPQRGNFPARNRIISGLSRGCLLVQAAQKSGARITAKFALDQGKTVFAVPGSIFDELSGGTHDLLMQGARLVRSSDDIFEEFGLDVKDNSCRSTLSEAISQQTITTHPLLQHLDRPCTLDDLVARSGEEIGSLQQQLFELQLSGDITQNFAGLWSRL